MTPEEFSLESLKLAMEQCRREATSDLKRVAELQTWFYNRISECGATPAYIAAEPEKALSGRRKAQAADKSKDTMS